jgi:hypothetical protein
MPPTHRGRFSVTRKRPRRVRKVTSKGSFRVTENRPLAERFRRRRAAASCT